MSRISTAQFASLLCVVAFAFSGCRSADMRCERETALLRAEILDIEDKYYSLLAQQRGGVQAQSVSSSQYPIINQGFPQGMIVDNGYSSGDIIYDDAIINGPIYGGQVYETYGDGVIYQDAPVLQGSSSAQPTIATREAAPDRSINEDEMNLDSTIEPETGFETEGVPFDDVDVELDGALPSRDDAGGASSDLLELPAMMDVGYSRNALSDVEVRSVTILKQHSHGEDIDGEPGDDGLAIMLQARDSNNQPVLPAAAVTVTVNDLSRNFRIGKWTFLPFELELFEATDDQNQPTILLHLPWSDDVPRSNEIRVNVTLIDDAGEKITDSLVLPIKPATDGRSADPSLVAGWTQSDDRWFEKSSRDFGRSNATEQRQPLRRLKAIPASSRKAIELPQWRPVR